MCTASVMNPLLVSSREQTPALKQLDAGGGHSAAGLIIVVRGGGGFDAAAAAVGAFVVVFSVVFRGPVAASASRKGFVFKDCNRVNASRSLMTRDAPRQQMQSKRLCLVVRQGYRDASCTAQSFRSRKTVQNYKTATSQYPKPSHRASPATRHTLA